MASKTIALYKCPLCSSAKARVSVSAKGLALVTCNRCHMQMFTRSEISDGHVRDKTLPFTKAEPEAVTDPAPAAEVVAPTAADPEPVPAPEPKKKSTFDIY